MKMISKAKKVITLSRVLTITVICFCSDDMNRISLNIRIKRRVRSTETPLPVSPKISITLQKVMYVHLEKRGSALLSEK